MICITWLCAREFSISQSSWGIQKKKINGHKTSAVNQDGKSPLAYPENSEATSC